jgi:homoserine O-acetyltransferase
VHQEWAPEVHANLPLPGKVAVPWRDDAAGPATKRRFQAASSFEVRKKLDVKVTVLDKAARIRPKDDRGGAALRPMERVPVPRAEYEVPLPADLRHLGEAVTASVTGPADAPLIVVLGGISADRFVCRGKDGGGGWWPGLIGEGCAVDPARHRILGLDFAADPTGRAAPSTGEQARIVCAALDAIGCARADAIIGASYGGMVALSLAEHFPERVARIVVISAADEPHASATAARELQRRVVTLGLASGHGEEALSIARGMAMMTYRTKQEFAERFTGGLGCGDPVGPTEPGGYLRAHGKAFRALMSPERFLSLCASVDRHKVDPARIACPALLIGATSDELVPPAQMEALAARLADARLHLVDSLYGHDMFLKEARKVGALVAPFLETA